MANREFLLENHIQNRKLLRKLLGMVSIEQANKIPSGFRNNIIWNCAHVISIHQTLLYGMCQKTFRIDPLQVNEYTIGTKPNGIASEDFIELIKSQLVETSLQAELDLQNEVFEVKRPFMTAIKVELKEVDQILAFINYHEGIHTGVVTSLLKFV